MTKKIILSFSIITFSATLYVNYLAGTGELNNLSSAEISAFYPTLFTPAGFTFSIWGIIYLLNLSFVLVQVYKLIKCSGDFNKRLNMTYILVCAFNMLWLYSFHYQLLLASVIIMVGMLSSLIYTVVITNSSRTQSKISYVEFVVFSVYLGWISVATIANISIWLVDLGFTHNNPSIIAMMVMSVGVALAIWQNYRMKNYWYGLVIIWAFYGIYVARSTDFANGANAVMIAALAGMALVMVSSFYHLSRKLLK